MGFAAVVNANCPPSASQSLAGSLIINPCMSSTSRPAQMLTLSLGDVDQTAKAINSALTLSAETRAQNWTKLFAVSLCVCHVRKLR